MHLLDGRKVLVTGAGGFIGSHLVEKLVSVGASTRAMVHYNALGSCGWLDHLPIKREIEIIAGDVCDRDSVRDAVKGCEIVFHLAALIAIPYSYNAPYSYVRTNIEGTLNVIQACRVENIERVIHTSTSEVYGTARYKPIDEDHPLQGQSPYSASKIGADKIVEAFHLSFGLPAVIVRPFNTFGPRQSARAVIPTIIAQCLTDRFVRLGNINPTRDLNFVADTVDGFLLAACSNEAVGKTVNLGSGREISIGALAQIVGKLSGSDVSIQQEEVRIRPENSEVEMLVADNTLAQNILGWRPKVSLEDGLLVTIDWVRQNLDRYSPGAYVI